MPEFQTIARVGDIPPGEGRAFPFDGTIVAIFNVDGEYTAINDTCPHMGASLSGGYVEGTCVTCPWHAWRFSVKDGTWLTTPAPRSQIPAIPFGWSEKKSRSACPAISAVVAHR